MYIYVYAGFFIYRVGAYVRVYLYMYVYLYICYWMSAYLCVLV